MAVALLLGPLSSMAAGQTRNVLVLSSSERPYAPQSGFADALMRDLVRASRDPIHFVEVPVQPARASGDAPDLATARHIRSTFSSHALDLVLTIGGPAATFAQQFREELFPVTPMLIAGVDRRFVENTALTEHQTVVATQHDPAVMIDEMLRLLPETRSVMVVVGTSHLEQFWLKEMQRDFRRFGNRVQFTWTNELSYEEILQRCRTMPEHSAIFFAILSLDGKGEPRVDGGTLRSLRAAANAPMFGLYGMGDGIVGGPMLSMAELSHTTAQVALRVLNGESPGTIKTPVQQTGRPTYDARELRRWNIDEARLLPANVVRFREPTTWQALQSPSSLAAMIGGFAAVTIGLVARRKRGPFGIGRSAPPPVAAPGSDTAVRAWTAGVDGHRVPAGDRASGPSRLWMDGIHPNEIDRCREVYSRAIERREPFQMEYRVRGAGNADRWMLDTGVPKFSGRTFDGFVGSTVDITEAVRARADLSNLSRYLMQAREREHAALAKTLRDDVCQRMVALTLRLHQLLGGSHDREIADITETLASLVGEIAAVSDPIHHRLDLLGLVAVGRQFCADLSACYDVAIHFADEGVPRDLPSHIAIALFRVLQEATVNALVHSSAREMWVSVRGTATEIRLQVVDRGVGFDTSSARSGGVGLVAIRERMKLVNGDCAIVSRPGEGTRVEGWVAIRP